ncbi:MAG: amidohydrolase family protein [Gammaproteobacteria bacterium]|nr:amidohydrolase family protein [Gammaproteobacteria bacterium]MBT8094834.1 amidohydrolase family protein [Gammaproteobacteria bacterium]MBT8104198.1 amidohydrolase family protein [Gammaproteobacteria bacterium]NNK24213.1 amidohydrolase family protein [Woeseiaceae bacterium]
MRRLLVAALVAVFAAGPALADSVTYIKAGALFDSKTGKVSRDAVIAVEGERIKAVGGSETAVPADANVIDLSDSFVMPGLMDMHTHVVGNLDKYFYAGYFQSPHRATIGGVVNAEKTLMAGFTTIRNVGANDYADVALRNAIDAGEIPGPRMAVSGPGLGITGGHCDRNSLNTSFAERGDGVADGPWAAREQVRKNVKYGADLTKFCATGGVFSKGTKVGMTQYTLEEMQAIVDESRTHERRVAAHAHGNEGIKRAILAGVDSIEHASFLDEEAIRMGIERGTYFALDIYNTEYTLEKGVQNGVPEENINKEREVGERQRQSFTLAVKMGAKVVFATDAGVYPHGDNGKQFARAVRFGMTPAQAIQSATSVSAELLGWEDRVGRIAPGMYADIVAVRGDPLENIAELEDVDFVMKGGMVYKSR